MTTHQITIDFDKPAGYFKDADEAWRAYCTDECGWQEDSWHHSTVEAEPQHAAIAAGQEHMREAAGWPPYGLNVGEFVFDLNDPDSPEIWSVTSSGLKPITSGAVPWDWEGIRANGGLGNLKIARLQP